MHGMNNIKVVKVNTQPIYKYIYLIKYEPGSVVGIVTAYRLDGPGIESRWG
jgi:hypothetical protein